MATEQAPDPIAAAMKKAGLVWLAWPGQTRPVPAWFAVVDDTYVVLADRPIAGADDGAEDGAEDGVRQAEQPLPGLADAGYADVLVPAKPATSRQLCWTAEVDKLDPDDPRWLTAAQVLRSERLNAEGLDTQLDRWRTGADLLVLRPVGVAEEPASRYDLPAATPPPGSPATTRTRLPRVLHRRSKRRPRLSG